MLRLFNTMTRRAEEFRPIDQRIVGLYTCGPTVYNYAHIGNLRTYVFEDSLKRALLMEGYQVRHVMNVTDVGHLTSDADAGEDKMVLGAAREGKSVHQIAEFFFQAFRKDLAALNIIAPDVWCRATNHIPQQIELIRRLEEKGFAYAIEDGVYFDTSRLADYGRLARLDAEGLQAGARIEMVKGKRNATDFALWKFSPKGKKRLMEWPSPWGVGFPGWHIECSAMAMHYLGDRLDIHCGGIDHIPVHHTNEIAQSESATGHKWVNWWMHGEFLTMRQSERMSKSSGEFLRLDSLAERGYDPLVYRYFCLNAHYRQQLEFSWEAIDAAASAFERLRTRAMELHNAQAGLPASGTPAEKSTGKKWLGEFVQAVEDDLNMPRALAAAWGLLKDQSIAPGDCYAALLEMDKVLGLGAADFRPRDEQVPPELRQRIEKLIAERAEARLARDFARSDDIRRRLAEEGIVLEDTPKGTVWHKA